MVVDAIVLAGGRSRRLGGLDKTALVVEGWTLLDRAVRAVAAARTVVVVGPWRRCISGDWPCIFVQEDPPFGGPVAGLAAGFEALRAVSSATSDFVVILAGDVIHPDEAIRQLLDGVRNACCGASDGDGFVAVDADHRPQYLLACYRTDALARALAELPGHGHGASMRALTERLRLGPVPLGAGVADDVDTWEDAARIGAALPRRAPTGEEVDDGR